MAQQATEAGDASNGRTELPTNRLIGFGDADRGHTVALTGGDLHYLTEVAIADIDAHGSTRQVLYGSLSGHAAILAAVFELARDDYERRCEANIRNGEAHRVRLTDAEVCAVLASIRDRADEWNNLVGDGMDQLGKHLSDQTGYERPM